jgi:hypothetical protein
LSPGRKRHLLLAASVTLVPLILVMMSPALRPAAPFRRALLPLNPCIFYAVQGNNFSPTPVWHLLPVSAPSRARCTSSAGRPPLCWPARLAGNGEHIALKRARVRGNGRVDANQVAVRVQGPRPSYRGSPRRGLNKRLDAHVVLRRRMSIFRPLANDTGSHGGVQVEGLPTAAPTGPRARQVPYYERRSYRPNRLLQVSVGVGPLLGLKLALSSSTTSIFETLLDTWLLVTM